MTEWRLDFCRKLAAERQARRERAGSITKNGGPSTGSAALNNHYIGLLGEAAGMLYLNPVKPTLRWEIMSEITGLPDLDDFIDVKTRTVNWYDLIIQPSDPSDRAYVLARAELAPRICLAGWCWGREAQQKEFWSDPAGGRAAYFVRTDAACFKPMAELREVLCRR